MCECVCVYAVLRDSVYAKGQVIYRGDIIYDSLRNRGGLKAYFSLHRGKGADNRKLCYIIFEEAPNVAIQID